MLVALDDHYTHGENGLGNAFGKAVEAAILLKGDFHVGVIFNEPVLLLEVGFVSGGVVDKALVEGCE